jgi:hypothetical protein
MSSSTARHIGVTIDRPADEVYAFLAEPLNFPKWAAGLGHSFSHVDGMIWSAQTPMGPMRIAFSERNALGVIDHTLIPADGPAMHNPMRVVPNGSGCEVVFTLFQREMSDREMARDAAMVARDLAALKALLER